MIHFSATCWHSQIAMQTHSNKSISLVWTFLDVNEIIILFSWIMSAVNITQELQIQIIPEFSNVQTKSLLTETRNYKNERSTSQLTEMLKFAYWSQVFLLDFSSGSQTGRKSKVYTIISKLKAEVRGTMFVFLQILKSSGRCCRKFSYLSCFCCVFRVVTCRWNCQKWF